MSALCIYTCHNPAFSLGHRLSVGATFKIRVDGACTAEAAVPTSKHTGAYPESRSGPGWPSLGGEPATVRGHFLLASQFILDQGL